ncbi:MAG TPA: histidine phosphatase family protein [Elainellaceae cyanobacterium]
MGQTVWIARHGNRQDFVDLDWQRKSERPYDPELSHDGVIQAIELGHRLKRESITHIFASPFLRTVETAHYVAETLDLPIKLEAGFGEHLNPDWFNGNPEKLSPETLAERFTRIDLEYRSRVTPQFPETWDDTMHRVKQAVSQIVEDYPDDLLIVGHGGSVLSAAIGLLDDPAVDVQSSLCCIVKLVREDDRWVMELNGDTSHLSTSEETIRWI